MNFSYSIPQPLSEEFKSVLRKQLMYVWARTREVEVDPLESCPLHAAPESISLPEPSSSTGNDVDEISSNGNVMNRRITVINPLSLPQKENTRVGADGRLRLAENVLEGDADTKEMRRKVKELCFRDALKRVLDGDEKLLHVFKPEPFSNSSSVIGGDEHVVAGGSSSSSGEPITLREIHRLETESKVGTAENDEQSDDDEDEEGSALPPPKRQRILQEALEFLTEQPNKLPKELKRQDRSTKWQLTAKPKHLQTLEKHREELKKSRSRQQRLSLYKRERPIIQNPQLQRQTMKVLPAGMRPPGMGPPGGLPPAALPPRSVFPDPASSSASAGVAKSILSASSLPLRPPSALGAVAGLLPPQQQSLGSSGLGHPVGLAAHGFAPQMQLRSGGIGASSIPLSSGALTAARPLEAVPTVPNVIPATSGILRSARPDTPSVAADAAAKLRMAAATSTATQANRGHVPTRTTVVPSAQPEAEDEKSPIIMRDAANGGPSINRSDEKAVSPAAKLTTTPEQVQSSLKATKVLDPVEKEESPRRPEMMTKRLTSSPEKSTSQPVAPLASGPILTPTAKSIAQFLPGSGKNQTKAKSHPEANGSAVPGTRQALDPKEIAKKVMALKGQKGMKSGKGTEGKKGAAPAGGGSKGQTSEIATGPQTVSKGANRSSRQRSKSPAVELDYQQVDACMVTKTASLPQRIGCPSDELEVMCTDTLFPPSEEFPPMVRKSEVRIGQNQKEAQECSPVSQASSSSSSSPRIETSVGKKSVTAAVEPSVNDGTSLPESQLHLPPSGSCASDVQRPQPPDSSLTSGSGLVEKFEALRAVVHKREQSAPAESDADSPWWWALGDEDEKPGSSSLVIGQSMSSSSSSFPSQSVPEVSGRSQCAIEKGTPARSGRSSRADSFDGKKGTPARSGRSSRAGSFDGKSSKSTKSSPARGKGGKRKKDDTEARNSLTPGRGNASKNQQKGGAHARQRGNKDGSEKSSKGKAKRDGGKKSGPEKGNKGKDGKGGGEIGGAGGKDGKAALLAQMHSLMAQHDVHLDTSSLQKLLQGAQQSASSSSSKGTGHEWKGDEKGSAMVRGKGGKDENDNVGGKGAKSSKLTRNKGDEKGCKGDFKYDHKGSFNSRIASSESWSRSQSSRSSSARDITLAWLEDLERTVSGGSEDQEAVASGTSVGSGPSGVREPVPLQVGHEEDMTQRVTQNVLSALLAGAGSLPPTLPGSLPLPPWTTSASASSSTSSGPGPPPSASLLGPPPVASCSRSSATASRSSKKGGSKGNPSGSPKGKPFDLAPSLFGHGNPFVNPLSGLAGNPSLLPSLLPSPLLGHAAGLVPCPSTGHAAGLALPPLVPDILLAHQHQLVSKGGGHPHLPSSSSWPAGSPSSSGLPAQPTPSEPLQPTSQGEMPKETVTWEMLRSARAKKETHSKDSS